MDTLNSNQSIPESTTSTQLESIQIDPIEECLKAIGIVHGAVIEQRYRYILARIAEAQDKALNATPWSVDRLQLVIDKEVQYKDWKFVVDHRDVLNNLGWDVDLRLRVEWIALDNVTGKMEKQQSRWWPISKHAVKTEVVNTAFKCVLVAEEHEIRETFKYKGQMVYNTHIDIDTLASVSESVDVRVDTRPEAPKNQRRE